MNRYNSIRRYGFILIAVILLSPSVYGQVGINTTTPNGILEIYSEEHGVVLPRVALSSTLDGTTVDNPQSLTTPGSIPPGTVVYNTNTDTSDPLPENHVYPGMYAWDGTKWIAQFPLKQNVLYESPTLLRTAPGITRTLVNQVFIAKYSGTYKISVRVNFGGGNAKSPKTTGGGQPSTFSEGNLNIARASGTFSLSINGSPIETIPAHAFSTAYEGLVGATNYFNIWLEHSAILEQSFMANSNNTISLTFVQDPAPEFENDGTSGADGGLSGGKGFLAFDIPCTVEIEYMGE